MWFLEIGFGRMRVLAIETSCDETAVAVVSECDGVFEINASELASQAQIHAKYGGVVPEVAAREHAVFLFPILENIGVPRDGNGIDAVAVTSGPGLVPALRVGVEAAKALAWCWGKPFVAVNHLEGHIYSVFINNPQNAKNIIPDFPSLCLLVSGGHTELILMRDHSVYELLGMTRDDAAGEAFDKVAKLLGLPYPGGPEISKIALAGDARAIDFPRPMINSGDLDFSFAGLKTAVRVYLESAKSDGVVVRTEDIAASFQQAVVDTLVTKTLQAVKKVSPRSVILSGGVSANTLLRETLASKLSREAPEVSFHFPELSLTGDNAVMIAAAGIMRAKRGEFADPLKLTADPNAKPWKL
jgi:N6-L-threonylcarbamoyladenine synthase